MLIYGLIFSYLYSYWILPKQCGYYPYINPTLYPILYNGMLIIPYNKKKAIHLNHWLIHLIICIMSVFIKIPKILIGFSFGLFIQGILYKDRFDFICDNPY
jgi:hypothetical protein